MSTTNGTENSSIFQTELKDAQIEPSKLPPLYPEKKDKNLGSTSSNDKIISYSNSSNINDDTSKINNENDTNNSNESNDIIVNSNDANNDNLNVEKKDNDNNNNESSFNNDNENNDSNTGNEINNESSQKEDNNEQLYIDNKEEIKICDEETDGVLHDQANALIGTIIGQNNENSNDELKDISNSGNQSNTNSQKQSTKTSQKNSTKSSTANSVRNSLPTSNRSSSSLTSHSSGAFRNSTKATITKRRIGKLPSSKISYNQEMSKIPKDILHNPYVTKRLNIFPPRKTNPPKAALSNVEYRNRVAPQKDELTEKLLNGEKLEEEPTIDQLKNSAHILRNIEKELIDKSQYPEAKKAAEAFQKTLLLIQKKSSSNEVKTGLEDLISKRNELIILADSRKEEWDETISKHQSDTEAHIRDMKQQHQEKIEKFNTEIPTELTPLFKRNSVSYLTMRSNEKYLALNRHFDEAQKMKLKADEIEEIEREENFSKMDEFYRRKREKMKQLQQLEIVNYINYADTRKSELIFKKEKCVSPPLLRAERIDREIKRICEKRGIKQKQLNFDLVDDERVKLIKSKEKENEEFFSKSSAKKPQKKASNETFKKDNDEEIKKLEEEEEEEKNQNDKVDDDDKGKINEEEEEITEDQNNKKNDDQIEMDEEEEIIEDQDNVKNDDQAVMEEEEKNNE